MRFRDRDDAGRRLAEALGARVPDRSGVVVLGLPRGGVPVARHVANALGAPLDVLCVRKLGLPSRPEFGMGAIGEGDVCVLDRNVVARAGVSEAAIDEVVRRERTELLRRTERYRGERPPLSLTGSRSSSTTAWPPGAPRAPRFASPAPWGRGAWCSRYRSRRVRP